MTTAPAIAAASKGGAWHSQPVEDVLAQLDSAATGLSSQDAAQRLAANGPNELKEGKRISPLQIFLGQIKSLIVWIFIAAGVISGLLGEGVDAIAILAIVVFQITLTGYQPVPLLSVRWATEWRSRCDPHSGSAQTEQKFGV